MAEIAELSQKMRFVVGAKVNRIGLLIWPDSDASEYMNSNIYLELMTADGIAVDVVLGTDSDGQTPSVEFRHVDGGVPFSALELRKSEWCKDEFWESQQSFSPELFVISSDSDSPLSIVCGQSVARGFLVCFKDSEDTATGIVLELGNGRRVWSVPSAYGNAVKCEVADDWWPSPVTLRDIM